MKYLTVLSLLFIFITVTHAQSGLKQINVHELATMLDESLLLIDVRTDQEYNLGYIPGAINIHIYSSNFEMEVENIDRYRPVFLYCQNGQQSTRAAQKMVSLGFQEIYVLNGGMFRWKIANKPIHN